MEEKTIAEEIEEKKENEKNENEKKEKEASMQILKRKIPKTKLEKSIEVMSNGFRAAAAEKETEMMVKLNRCVIKKCWNMKYA
jgi:acetate kinase